MFTKPNEKSLFEFQSLELALRMISKVYSAHQSVTFNCYVTNLKGRNQR